MNARLHVLVAAALACGVVATAAAAETVFRCGSSYSHAPCDGAHAVDVGSSVDAAQRAEARAVAARERQLVAELVRDRHDRERAVHPASAGSLSAMPAARAASAPAKKQHATKKRRHESDDRDFVAVVPATVAKK
jgi:CDGSH-type Zn-finger protein